MMHDRIRNRPDRETAPETVSVRSDDDEICPPAFDILDDLLRRYPELDRAGDLRCCVGKPVLYQVDSLTRR